MEIPLGQWDALGPFPSGMREHPLLASPLHAYSAPVPNSPAPADPDIAFAFAAYDSIHPPSAYVPGGRALWKRFKSNKGGVVDVSFPEGDWAALKRDHGWSSAQYRAELRTSTKIAIPERIRVDALACAEYAFVKEGDSDVVWYNADVYGFAGTPSGTRGERDGASNFSRAIALEAGEYIVLVRALYEVRMFGDPGDAPPVISATIRIFSDAAEEREDDAPQVVVEPGIGVLPDVRAGFFMGEWASVGVRVRPRLGATSLRSVSVTVVGEVDGVHFATPEPAVLAEGQTRAVALRITQSCALDRGTSTVRITVTGEGKEHVAERDITWRKDTEPFGMTFASPAGNVPALVSLAMVVPPKVPQADAASTPPVLLGLHGAGVDVASPFWVDSLPPIPGMWGVLPSGRNEWGEDWHGGSVLDVWAARDALPVTLRRVGVKVSHETVLVGHSNGGQGAWYSAARFPDRIRGVVAVAGYLKIQDYVPYSELASHNYADPALMGILLCSLAGYNNDLHASNLASVPVLAVHGREDDNVPPRHSRTHIGILSSWLHAEHSNEVTYVEVDKRGHWWDGILHHPAIVKFLADLPPQKSIDTVRNNGFTLACANPDESGGKAGIRIVELATPGRLARLDVNAPQWKRGEGLSLHGTNVKRIAITTSVAAEEGEGEEQVEVELVREDGQWKPDTRPRPIPPIRAYGPMIRLLASHGPLTLVVPDTKSEAAATLHSLATRYAHDVFTYHRLDAVIVTATQALWSVAEDKIPGNVVVFGRPDENRFADWLIRQERTPVRFPTKSILSVDGRVVWERGSGIITLHPHPTSPKGLLALVAGNDTQGTELAARLLPLRTGVPVPDWAVVTPRCKWQAAGGFAGAGFWSGEWGWSEMCWMDRD